jgi:FtsZ-interacting cell division protein ZipA
VDTTTLIWIIVGIVVVLAIVVVALLLTARGRRERRREHQHDRAEKLREDARQTELQARQHEAEAARAQADAAAAAAAAEDAKARAAEASIDAERRAGRVGDHRAEAEDLRRQHAEAMRKADDVDPYVDGSGSAAAPSATAYTGDSGDGRDTVVEGTERERPATDARAVDDNTHTGTGVRDAAADEAITRPPAPPQRTERA